ncbi:MAG: hypothetical protein U1F64_16870 [Burkholderiales bacterium]
MMSIRKHRATLAGAFFCALTGSAHAIQVVGDEACQTYAVDIAAFATCENGRVTTPEGPAAPARAPDRTAAAKAPVRDGAASPKATTLARDGTREPAPAGNDRTR